MSAAVSRYFSSSIGRKQLIALSGLLLCGFLVTHLLGNFLLLVGAEAFNLYAHKLISMGPLLYVAEAGLAGLFVLHLGLAIKLTIENKVARGQKYYVKNRTGRGETIMSASMPYTGLILLAFLISHLIHFKFGPHYSTDINGVIVRDLYKTVVEFFRSPLNTAWYVISMAAAALHTSHGFSSAFQSFGFNHGTWTPKVKLLGVVYAIFVAGGFALISVLLHVKGA
ncbi:MAG: succinate dehydrogenase cytochrome b subunit [Bacteriovoracaceae bacterium]|nr:succinate dehydrogenase cytochrome b subunit [Bacteriovoracaceae bacterium]